VAGDTQRLTPGGAQLTVPAGWSIATQKNLVLLTPPEADTHLAIVDTQAPDARAAVTAAWLFDLETFRASGRKHNQRLCTPTTLIVVLGPPPIRHPERSASQIYPTTKSPWRVVEGPRRCSLAQMPLKAFQQRSHERRTSRRLYRQNILPGGMGTW
jgi:hypothetical protein